ncbi:MAG: dTDP-4-dehydrorhamnose reductase, partial [Gammaproteobacteria bacterium]
ELYRSLLPLGDIFAVNRNQFDMANADSFRSVIREIRPDVIVNAAAYTMVDQAETEEALAVAINGVAPGILAEEAERVKALLIHYGTDYVFNGEKLEPYTEDDVTGPLNVYGRSKLQGELAIRSIGCDYLILRTSWVYSARGGNFVKTMLRLFKEREELKIVVDQIGSPTWARLIADTSAQILMQIIQMRKADSYESTSYHLTSVGNTSWYNFANEILRYTRQYKPEEYNKISVIHPVASAEYPQIATRPANSCMSTEKLESRFAIQLPDWKQCLHLCLDEILET